MNTIDREQKRFIWVVISALIQGILLGIYTVIRSGPLLCMPLSIIFIVPFVLLYYYLLTIVYIQPLRRGLTRESATLQVIPRTLEGI